MKHIVFDAYSFMALFQNEPGAPVVAATIKQILTDSETQKGWLTAVNLGEIFYMMSRKISPEAARQAIPDIDNFQFTIVAPDRGMCLKAAALKASYKLSYADAFAACLTLDLNGVLITGDPEFQLLEEAEGLQLIYLREY